MTSIESLLTREFNLRFLDAHTLTTEAKLSLGIIGYPTPEQLPSIHLEAERLFYSNYSSQERSNLRQKNMEFESMKHAAQSSLCSSSVHSSLEEEESSVASSSLVSRSSSSSSKRKVKGFRSFLFRPSHHSAA